MDLTPIVVAVSSAATTLALVAAFAAGRCTSGRQGVRHLAAEHAGDEQLTATRITLADLRTRMRRLEAIASGVDL